MFTRRKWRKFLAGGFIMLLLGFISLGVLVKPQKAEAVGPVAVTFTVETIFNKIADYFKNAIVIALRRAGENALQLLLQRLAHDAAVWIASGGSGQGPLFQYKGPLEYFSDVGGQVVGEFVGDLNRDWSVGFDLCNPTDPQLKLQLKLGVLQSIKPREPKCDIFQVVKNWERMSNNLKANFVKQFEPKEMLSMFQQAFQPGNNDIGMMFTLNDKMRVSATLNYQTAQMNRGVKSGDFTDYTGTVSKRVETPRNVVTEQFIQNAIKNPADQKTAEILATYISGAVRPETYPQALLATVTSTFINTLGSELQKRLMEGLFKALNPSDQGDDIYTGVAYTGRSAAEAQFAELKRPPIQVQANIDYLSEFASCPERYKGINNCVVDADFVTAVTHYNATREGMTVKEAIDEDLLHGNWRIYPIDHIKNIEENGTTCYRDGYCHRNLMRLRRARIIPVGWEMVTELCNRDTSPAGVSCSRNDPPTLAEVVRNYDNCDPKNPESIFCHLIDPNWVLKAPTTQCLARVSGPLIEGQGVASRQDICVDDASCILEDDNGSCKAYGYCTREKNVWRFGGDTCEARFEGCRTYETKNGDSVSFIESTIDSGVCDSSNAGCRWYSSVRDSAGTWSEADRDRIYFNNQVEECDESDVGCTRFIRTAGGLGTNMLRNANFELNIDGLVQYPDSWYKVSSGNSTSSTPQIQGPGGQITPPQSGGSPTIAPAGPTPGGQGVGQLTPVPPGFEYLTDATKSYQNDGAVKPGYQGIYQDVPVISRKNYILSTYVMNTSIVKGEAILMVDLYNSGNKVKTIQDTYELANSTTHSRLSLEFSIDEPVDTARIILKQSNNNSAMWFDSVMFEELSPYAFNASSFVDYGTKNLVRLKRAPDYLGCYKEWGTFASEVDCVNEGGDWDNDLRTCSAPTVCNSYAGWCSASEVGCNLYKQAGTDVPAIAGTPFANDFCPQGCAGYDSFIQKPTRFEDGGNLEFFIPSTARTCNLESVGCEEFTNLEADNTESAEAKEYYSFLRDCKKPDQSCKTFYTWEGSDTSGYQLRTFSLEADGNAPKVKGTDTCDEAKFKSNAYPDCRQFYHVDDKGVTHISYASLSLTKICSNQCTTYRKTNSSGKVECEKYGGLWDTNQNACIVKGLPSQSTSCAAEYAGCREYKGNTGNNVRTAFYDDFEEGTNSNWNGGENSNVAIKQFEHSIWNKTGTSLTKDITDVVQKGSSYTISFYARSRSKAGATLSVKYTTNNLGQKVVDNQLVNQNGTVQLSDEWKQYTVGPVTFWDDNSNITQTILSFSDVALQELYVDKILVQEITDRVFIVKNSWTTPLQCDNNNITPFGRLGPDQPSRDNPQAQLNCKEYSDPKNQVYFLKSFTSLCRESAVGCEALINTQNSEQALQTHYNVLCDAVTGTIDKQKNTCTLNNGGDKKFTCNLTGGQNRCYIEQAVNIAINRTCNAQTGTINGNVCTINNNGGSCRLPQGGSTCFVGTSQKYDNSEVVVPGDRLEFIVNDNKFECGVEAEGCQEIARPTLNANAQIDKTLSEQKRWQSIYILNQPDKYLDTLCNDSELFCEEFTGTNNAKKYFKDPGKRTCEYKTNVKIVKNNVVTLGSGWFKTNPTGTDPEPCYPTLTIDPQKRDQAHGTIVGSWDVIGEQQFHLVQKSSNNYDNWVGLCPESQNMCTLFIDPLGTADPTEQNKVDISHYFYLKNDKVDVTSCNGQVNLADGCVLFNDTSRNLENGYHAESSYDLAQKEKKAILPISCEGVDLSNLPSDKQFCKDYVEKVTINNQNNVSLGNTGGTQSIGGINPAPTAGNQITGGTVVVAPKNNTNTIIKVNRDRTCGEWLTCQSATKAKDNGKPITLCSKLVRCTSYNSSSGTGQCDDTEVPNFDRLTIDHYQKRGGEKYKDKEDVITWTDRDYSGYSIPNYYGLDTFVGLGYEQGDSKSLAYRLFHDTQNKDPKSEIRLGVCKEDKDCQEVLYDNSDPQNPRQYSPKCVSNRCVVNVDGSNVGRAKKDGSLSEASLDKYSPEPSCRAYPEREAPFPIFAALEPSIASDYENANFCEDCGLNTCSYEKVTYGNKSETRYYSSGAKAPKGLCIGGSLDGKECDPLNENACKTKGGDGKYQETGGRCEFKDKRIVKFDGWEGYCLERDYSSGVRNINSPDFVAPCITWMPVKYMNGLRNLYENYATAGFNVEQEVRYCAETTLVRDVYTSSMSCASQTGDIWCNDTEVDRKECRTNMECPQGHFVVYGGCETWRGGPNITMSMCYNDGDPGEDFNASRCPYQCVPMGSIHAVGYKDPKTQRKIEAGSSCWDTALSVGNSDVREFKSGFHYSVETTDSSKYEFIIRNDDKGYFVPLDYAKARDKDINHTIFSDCVLPNVDMTDPTLGKIYAKPDVAGEYKLACKTLLQVNAFEDKGKDSQWVNKAFTDRVAYDASQFKTTNGSVLEPYGWLYNGGRFDYRTPGSPFSFAADKYVYQPPQELKKDETIDNYNALTGFVHPISGCRNDDKKPTYFGYGVRPHDSSDKTIIYCDKSKFGIPITAKDQDKLRPNQTAIAMLFELKETTSFHKVEFNISYSAVKPSDDRCNVTQEQINKGTENKDCQVCKDRSQLAVECTTSNDCQVEGINLGACQPAGQKSYCSRFPIFLTPNRAKVYCGRELTADEKQTGNDRKGCYTTQCKSSSQCSGNNTCVDGLCTGGEIVNIKKFEDQTKNKKLIGTCHGSGAYCSDDKDCYGVCVVPQANKDDGGTNVASGWCQYSRVSPGDAAVQPQGEKKEEAIKRLKQLFARVYEGWKLTSNITSKNSDYFNLQNPSVVQKAVKEAGDFPRSHPQFTYGSQFLNWNTQSRKNAPLADKSYQQFAWDVSDGSDPNIIPVPPLFAADTLSGNGEGVPGSVSVNGNIYDPLTSQAVELEEGTPVLLSFYAWAHRNQMPLRRVVVSWAKNGQKYRIRDARDNMVTCSSGAECSRLFKGSICETYNGSTQKYCQLDSRVLLSPDIEGRYKNRRAVCNVTDQEGEKGKGFGGVSQLNGGDGSCDNDPFIFENLYLLRKVVDQNGKRTTVFACEEYGGTIVNQIPRNSAYGTEVRRGCKFTIQIHLRDNWGWCTGTCPAGQGGKFGGCFDQTSTLDKGDNYCNINEDDGKKAWKDAAEVIVYERQK